MEKAPGTVPKTIAATDTPITNPHNVASVYANHIGAGATATDFSLFFMEVGQNPLTGPKQEVKAIVTLPMPMAGAMIEILQQIMKNSVEIVKQWEVTGTRGGK